MIQSWDGYSNNDWFGQFLVHADQTTTKAAVPTDDNVVEGSEKQQQNDEKGQRNYGKT